MKINITKEKINEAFGLDLPPGADSLRTLADGLDKAFDAIYELEQKIKILESKVK